STVIDRPDIPRQNAPSRWSRRATHLSARGGRFLEVDQPVRRASWPLRQPHDHKSGLRPPRLGNRRDLSATYGFLWLAALPSRAQLLNAKAHVSRAAGVSRLQ